MVAKPKNCPMCVYVYLGQIRYRIFSSLNLHFIFIFLPLRGSSSLYGFPFLLPLIKNCFFREIRYSFFIVIKTRNSIWNVTSRGMYFGNLKLKDGILDGNFQISASQRFMRRGNGILCKLLWNYTKWLFILSIWFFSSSKPCHCLPELLNLWEEYRVWWQASLHKHN